MCLCQRSQNDPQLPVLSTRVDGGFQSSTTILFRSISAITPLVGFDHTSSKPITAADKAANGDIFGTLPRLRYDL